MKKLRISSSLNLHYYEGNDKSENIRQGLAFNKKAGFDAADLSLYNLDFSSDTSWRGQVERALSDSRDIGLNIELCHLPFSGRVAKEPDYVPIFNERMHRAIDAAKLLCVDYAVLHPNTTTIPMNTYSRKEQYDSVMAHLSPFAEHAARIGLNIVVEIMRYVPHFAPVHRYTQTPEELCEVADALGIGVCWDFGHAHIDGVKQSEGIKYVGKRLKVLHVNDNFATEDEHLPPFIGNIDWRDAMHGLSEVGFDGLLNFELSTGRLPKGAREAYASLIVESANALMSYIE